MHIKASAPSNIALIKYMGKTGATGNLPANASLSYTLEHLRTFVEIEVAGAGAGTMGSTGAATAAAATEATDQWAWLPDHGGEPLVLSELGRDKFLHHFQKLKDLWKIPGFYLVRSTNNFPSDCGLASSASSFAALTLATYELAKRFNAGLDLNATELSRLSRQGSGSSCRSFFTPWAAWRGEGAEDVSDVRFELEHAVIVVASEKKAVSSSEAHVRVNSSLLMAGRRERTESRMHQLLEVLREGARWQTGFEICWAEFWDMHALFESSRPSFGYLTPESVAILSHAREIWRAEGDGPWVTMDAGANVHLLFRKDQVIAGRADRWLGGLTALASWRRSHEAV